MSEPRRLIVLRHAKSDWNTDAPTDHARPLNGRGRSEAPRVGEALARRGWIPERVLCSDATRTKETWKRVAKAFEVQIPVEFSRALYGAGIGDVQEAVSRVPGSLHTIMVVSHNPGSEHVVEWLSDEPVTMTTANAALLEIEAPSWAEAIAERGAWQLVDIIRPKEL